jgi:DNA-3-methyladenine glycosylase
MYDLFNVVTGRQGQPQAVLIRALEPLSGMLNDMATARGPGKLTRALALDRRHSGRDLTRPATALRILPGRRIQADAIATGGRIGVDYAGEWANAPLRFWIAGHPAVSGKPASRRARAGRTVLGVEG